MMKDIIKDMRKAFEEYNIDEREDIENSILNYLYERFNENIAELEQVIDINKSNITFEEILEVVKAVKDEVVTSYGKTIINNQNFMFSQMMMPVGLIAVETYDTLEIIKYWLEGIKTRNAIAISSVEYNEASVESIALIIIHEALKKYNIDENLIVYLPYEECFYECFDKVLYTYDDQGKRLEKIKEDKIINEEQRYKNYVYLADNFFEEEAKKNEDAELITGELNEVIEKVSGAFGLSVYTKDTNTAFNIINLANCKNIFVNTNIENAIEVMSSDNPFYQYRNVIIPVRTHLIDDESEESNYGDQTNALVEYKDGLFVRLARKFKAWFKL